MIALYVIVISALLLFPDICAQSAREALTVWGLQVMPSLFPYMFFCKLLAERIRKTASHFNPALMCALLGAVGGSPSGAALVASSMHGLSKRMALSLCAFTGTISPMFFLGTVKSWTADLLLPQQLYLSQFIGAVLAAFCVFFLPCSKLPLPQMAANQGTDKEKSALSQSIDAILQIGGYIICFSVLASLMNILPVPNDASSFVHGFLEVSGGVHALMHSSLPMKWQRIVLAFVSGFGGCSILFQNYLFLKPYGIRLGMLAFLALLRALFSVIVMLLLSAI